MILRRYLLGASFALFLITLQPLSLSAQSQNTSLVVGKRYAIIIGGPGGEEKFTGKYFSQTQRLFTILTDSLKYKRSNIVYLFESQAYDSLTIDGVSNAANIRMHVERLGKKMKSEDQFLFCLIGHGSYDGQWGKFNLVGPDLKDLDYAQLLQRLPARNIICVNTASASGSFIDQLSKKQRIVITATKNGLQNFETNFADFFIASLANEAADFNKDGRISIKESFQFARSSQDQWFSEQKRIRAEHPLLDDNGDGKGSQQIGKQGDGLLAEQTYLGPLSSELEETLHRVQIGAASATDSLLLRKLHLEEKIEKLKANRENMDAEEYAKTFERLVIELATTNRKRKETQ